MPIFEDLVAGDSPGKKCGRLVREENHRSEINRSDISDFLRESPARASSAMRKTVWGLTG
jgi:hypothetical protein